MSVSYLLPNDPGAKKVTQSPNKRGVSEISEVTSSNENKGNVVKGMGKTGVCIHWHLHKNFKQLTTKKKKELIEWRKKKGEPETQNPKKEGGRNRKKFSKEKN